MGHWLRKDFANRFWKSVKKTDGCWFWTAGKAHGYGTIGYIGRSTAAHRASWLIHFGELPEQHVLHTCDQPLCVNPEHLYLGNDADNHRDMSERGRSTKGRKRPGMTWISRGEASPFAKLTEEQVRQIRQRVEAGEHHGSIAKDYGITRQYVWGLTHLNRYWQHIP